MTADEKRNQKAYEKAVEEIEKDKVNEIKVLVKDALERLHKAEQKRRDAVAEIQTLKHDLDDLRKGRMDKIKERHEKDKKADTVSPFTMPKIDRMLEAYTTHYVPAMASGGANWATNVTLTTAQTIGQAVSGTYCLSDGTVKNL